jgi:hypothetical protein
MDQPIDILTSAYTGVRDKITNLKLERFETDSSAGYEYRCERFFTINSIDPDPVTVADHLEVYRQVAHELIEAVEVQASMLLKNHVSQKDSSMKLERQVTEVMRKAMLGSPPYRKWLHTTEPPEGQPIDRGVLMRVQFVCGDFGEGNTTLYVGHVHGTTLTPEGNVLETEKIESFSVMD